MYDAPNLYSLRDVVFVVEGERYPAHRVVVAASSPVFEAMLAGGFQESSSVEVVLEGIKSSAWDAVLQFLYRGTILVRDDAQALAILRIAHRYQLSVLLDFLEQFLLEKLNLHTVCERYVLADKLELDRLRFEARRLIEEQFLRVCDQDAFRCMPYHVVEELFQSEELVVRSEMTVFNAIVEWGNATPQMREAFNAAVEAGNLDPVVVPEDDPLSDRKDLADDLVLRYVDVVQLTPAELRRLREYVESSVCFELVTKVMDELLHRACKVCAEALVVNSRLSLGAARRNTAKLSLSHRLYMGAPNEKLSTDSTVPRFSPWKCDGNNRLWRLRYVLNDGNDVEGPALGVSLMMRSAFENESMRVTVRFQIGLYHQNGEAHHVKTSTETEFCTERGAMWGWNEFISWKEVCNSFKTEAPETLLFGSNLLFVDYADVHRAKRLSGSGLGGVALSLDVVL